LDNILAEFAALLRYFTALIIMKVAVDAQKFAIGINITFNLWRELGGEE